MNATAGRYFWELGTIPKSHSKFWWRRLVPFPARWWVSAPICCWGIDIAISGNPSRNWGKKLWPQSSLYIDIWCYRHGLCWGIPTSYVILHLLSEIVLLFTCCAMCRIPRCKWVWWPALPCHAIHEERECLWLCSSPSWLWPSSNSMTFFKFTHGFHLMSKSQLHHISLGLVYLHSKKIIHGDLKAVNIIHS